MLDGQKSSDGRNRTSSGVPPAVEVRQRRGEGALEQQQSPEAHPGEDEEAAEQGRPDQEVDVAGEAPPRRPCRGTGRSPPRAAPRAGRRRLLAGQVVAGAVGVALVEDVELGVADEGRRRAWPAAPGRAAAASAPGAVRRRAAGRQADGDQDGRDQQRPADVVRRRWTGTRRSERVDADRAPRPTPDGGATPCTESHRIRRAPGRRAGRSQLARSVASTGSGGAGLTVSVRPRPGTRQVARRADRPRLRGARAQVGGHDVDVRLRAAPRSTARAEAGRPGRTSTSARVSSVSGPRRRSRPSPSPRSRPRGSTSTAR